MITKQPEIDLLKIALEIREKRPTKKELLDKYPQFKLVSFDFDEEQYRFTTIRENINVYYKLFEGAWLDRMYYKEG